MESIGSDQPAHASIASRLRDVIVGPMPASAGARLWAAARAYVVALLLTVCALGLALIVDPHVPGVPLGLFLIAVTSAAWRGGLGPGLAATAASILLIDYYLEAPYASLVVSSTATLLELVLFVSAAVAISMLSASLRRARRRAERATGDARASELRARLLAEAGRILASSLDYEATLQSLSLFLVPAVADECTIDVSTGRGELQRVAAVGGSGGRADAPLQRTLPRSLDAAPGHRATVSRPLQGQLENLGELMLVRLGTSNFSASDIILVEDIAHRAATAIENARLYRAAEDARESRERTAERLSRLNAMAAILAEGLTLKRTANLLLTQAVSVAHAASGRIHVVDARQGRLSLVGAIGPSTPTGLSLTMLEQEGSAGQSIRFVDDVLICPLVLHSKPVGALELVPDGTCDLADDDVFLLNALARQGAQALERARLYDAERRARAEAEMAMDALRAVQVVTDAALVHLDLNDLLRELLTRVRDLLLVDLAAVLIVSDDGQDLVERASVGVLANTSRGARVRIGEGVSGRIAETRAPLIVEDLSTAQVLSPVLRNAGVRSLLGVPLLADGRLIGVLHVDAIDARQFTAEDTHILQLVADRLAMAINQARLYENERLSRAEAERLAAEHAAVLAQIADGVVIADHAGMVTFANDAARAFAGGSISLRAVEALQQAVDGEGDQVIVMAIEGTQGRVAIGRAVPVRKEDGSPLGAVLTLRDVTAERMLDRQKDEFFSSVSHDLRTPVATIKGAVEVVLENEPPGVAGPLHRMLQIINDEADRMSTLVDDLLELSRAQSGHVQLRVTNTELRGLVERVTRSIEPLASARSQHVVCEVPARPVDLLVDAPRVERALLNLIGNAQKYGRDGGLLQVRLTDASPEIRIDVCDDGPGIPEADQQRIFDRFYRASDVATRRIQGSGLGLPIARALIELHGGRIEVRSAPGAGATFTIVLPHTRPGPEEHA